MSNELLIRVECFRSQVYTARYLELRAQGASPKRAQVSAKRHADLAVIEFLYHENQH